MKTLLSLSALLITLTLTAQSNPATWYLNDTSGNGIQSPTSTAIGDFSTAMGDGSRAPGDTSTAMGNYARAIGDFSTAMGDNTTAVGDFSTAMGRSTTASDFASVVIGYYNSSGKSATSVNSFSTSAPAFVIGNGTDSFNRSDALTVLFDGTTTIAGAVTATAFIGDGSQLTNLSVSSPFSFNDTSGDGIQSNTNTASGSYSIATGIQTTASGDFSTAMGYETTASGDFSTAMGDYTTASGGASTAMGEITTASGGVSTAMGYETTASDRSSLVIGEYNLLGSTVTNSATQFSTENTAFVIGNGTNSDNRSDALTVLFDGTTNVAGAVTATAFIGDGSQLTNLSSEVLSFYFNDTSLNGVQSDTNTASGEYSTAMGYQTEASGFNSTAMGYKTTASGGTSTAMGNNTTASRNFSTAMGRSTTASGEYSTAMGSSTTASGDYSTAMGSSTTASGDYSTAMGNDITASGFSSTAMGYETTASGGTSTAMGYQTEASGGVSTAMGAATTASGNFSTAMGAGTTASDRSSLVIGEYNLLGFLGSTVTNSATEFRTENTAFVIGNGTDNDSRSDALTVLFDGTTTIAGDLSINSDARLKANIISLGSTLAKLLQIDGKSYTMKKDENKKQKIGVLAQDIEKVFPELVSESNGVKSVNYQGLVPVLINALKEQDNKMNEQEARIERLEKLLLDS